MSSKLAKEYDRATYINNGEEFKIKIPYAIEIIPELNQNYKNIFRLHYWKILGKTKNEIYKILRNYEVDKYFIDKFWNVHPSDLTPPRSVSPYVRIYELNLLELNFEPFKPVQIIRNFAPRSGLYNTLKKSIHWVPAVLRKRNHVSGEVIVHKNKKTGKRMNASSRSIQTGWDQHLDQILQEMKQTLEIKDPHAYILANYYESGKCTIGSHQHDFWSAILSFGASRVMLVEGRPVVLHDGDLIVLGTQKHAIPKQPKVRQGRVSVAIFYNPERGYDVEEENFAKEEEEVCNEFSENQDNFEGSDFALDFYENHDFVQQQKLEEMYQLQEFQYYEKNRLMKSTEPNIKTQIGQPSLQDEQKMYIEEKKQKYIRGSNGSTRK